jgi:hypothetical protein
MCCKQLALIARLALYSTIVIIRAELVRCLKGVCAVGNGQPVSAFSVGNAGLGWWCPCPFRSAEPARCPHTMTLLILSVSVSLDIFSTQSPDNANSVIMKDACPA